jgi:hypothetical protein
MVAEAPALADRAGLYDLPLSRTLTMPFLKALPRAYFKQCGKPECKRMKGGERHGPYFYQSKYEKGKIRSLYIGKSPTQSSKQNGASD